LDKIEKHKKEREILDFLSKNYPISVEKQAALAWVLISNTALN